MEKRSIKEIKLILEEIQTLSDERLTELRSDERKGVQDLIAKFERQYAKKAERAAHFEEMQIFERAAKQKGYQMIAGIDEVGRGPLAGPVVAAAVILPEGMEDIGLDDSKKLSAKKRAEIFDIIKEVSESGTTVLLVEQNAKKALSIADRAYVLETGRITLEGKASDLLHDESVQKAYLGE